MKTTDELEKQPQRERETEESLEMDENKKKLTKAEMEKAKGGIGSMTDSPHCLKCGCITEFIGGAYRCCSPTCVEVGRPKGKDDVDWY